MNLAEARVQIDEIDRRILELFVQRMEVVNGIAAYKLERHISAFDPEREAQMLRRAAKAGGEQFSDCTCCLMEDMLSISRDYQLEYIRRHEEAEGFGTKP